jgi:alkylhydroperoxidase/carboxymuconolactone decarboxylase family protein YurZ
LCGLFWGILKVAGAKKAGLSDEEMRETLKKMVPLNMAALLLSVFGLMMVVMGIFLG